MKHSNGSKFGKNAVIAAAAATVAGTLLLGASAAQAQLNFGDMVTVNSFFNTSQSGRMYKVTPTGTMTQIGSDFAWNDRPLAVSIEGKNSLIVAFGTQSNQPHSYSQTICRVDATTGARTILAYIPNNEPVVDIAKNPSTGELYVSTGTNYYTTGNDNGKIYKFNSTTNALNQIWTSNTWDQIPQQMAIDPTDPTKMYFGASQNMSTNASQHYSLDLTTNTATNIGSSGWNVRREGLAFADNGTLYGGRGNPYAGGNWGYQSYFDVVNKSDLSTTSTPQTLGWEQYPHKLAFDSSSTRMYFGTSESQQSNGSYTSYLRYYDTTLNTTGSIANMNNQWGFMDVDVMNFGVTNTGNNNLTIGTSTSNVTNGPNFRADDANATLDVASLISSLGSNSSSSVRPGVAGANNQAGNVTLAAAIDYTGVGDKSLTLRATNDVAINSGSTIHTTSSDNLSLHLVANNENTSTTSTGKVQVDAAIALGNGTFTATGKAFDNTATVTTTGAVSITTTAGATVGADVTGGSVTVSAGSFTQNGIVTATSGNVAITTTSATGDLVVGGSINAASGSVTLATASGRTATINADVTAGGQLSLNASGGTLLGSGATLSAASLELNGTSLTLNGPLNVTGSLGTSGTIGVEAGGVLTRDALPASIPTINVDGGTVSIGAGGIATGGNFTFNAGTVQVTGNQTFNGSNGISTRVMGSQLSVGKTLDIGGNLTLATNYTLSGGTLKAANLVSPSKLTWTSGTVEITGADVAISNTGMFGKTVTMSAGKDLVVSGATTGNINIASNGILNLSGGSVTATTAVNNAGTIVLSSVVSRLGGTSLNNTGIVKGTGRIEVDQTTNDIGGSLRTTSGQKLLFTGGVGNLGTVDVQTGGEIEIQGYSTNEPTGRMIVNGGTLRLPASSGAIYGLTNSGQMQVSGLANIYGDIRNVADAAHNIQGKIIVSGGGTANFYSNIKNGPIDGAAKPEFRVSGGSTAVVWGDYSGAGDITGAGTILFEGSTNFGDSPAIVNIGGSIGFGANSVNTLELGGTTPGMGGYDQLNVAGSITLDGTLNVVNYGGFVPQIGQTFDLINAGNVLGSFDHVNLPGGLWEVNQTSGGLSLTVVPEPSSLLLLGLGSLAMAGRRRRRMA